MQREALASVTPALPPAFTLRLQKFGLNPTPLPA